MTHAATLLMTLRRRGVELEAPETGGLHYRAPAGVMTLDLKTALAAHKREVVQLLAAEQEALALFHRIQELRESSAAAEAAGDGQTAGRLEMEALQLVEGRYSQAVSRYWDLAGDCWEQLLDGIAAAAVLPGM